MSEFIHNDIVYNTYELPNENTLETKLKLTEKLLIIFSEFYSFNLSILNVDFSTFVKIFIRTDQRRLHYKMYHNMDINELKEVAVLCYWILKYKPLTWKMFNKYSPNGAFSTYKANEYFCLFLIISTISRYWHQVKGKAFVLPDDILADLLYDLEHRNTSYDSMVMFVDGLARI